MKFNKLLKESQFHGGKRLADRNCRGLWSTALLMLLGSAVMVICTTVWRFLDNPTYMVQQEMVENSMDFPSVLVCPEVYYPPDKVNRFLSHIKLPRNLNKSYVISNIYMLGAFYSPDILYKVDDLKNMEHLLEFNNMDVDTAGRLLTSACDNTLIRCRWHGIIVNCSSLFRMELTGDGYCCVFNGRSLQQDHETSTEDFLHPKWKTNAFGYQSGLMLAVNQSQFLTNVDLSYKWLALQSSQHYVESTVNGTALNPGSEQWVEYHIRNFQIGDVARGLSHELRKCRLEDEPLKFFPVYHKKYCVLECEVANTLKKCNCVRLVHPRPNGAPYCKSHQLQCAQHAMVSYDSDQCACLSACDVPSDYVKIMTFNFMSSVRPVDTFYDGLNLKTVTIVRAFIPSRRVTTKLRWSYFNSMDLFAQLGGAFNVFFGCSVLTLLELGILAYRAVTPKIPAKIKIKSQNRQELNLKTIKKKDKIFKKNLNLKY